MRRMTFLRTCILLVAILGVAGTANAVITFDEYPIGTIISNQYAGVGVEFLPGNITGRLPQIDWDGAMPTEPILRPTGEPDFYTYEGDFWMKFPSPVNLVEFDSGYWDNAGSGIIQVYDPDMNPLANLTNAGTGVELISISGPGWSIGYVYFNSIADGAGADIDNLVIPAPGAILLGSLGVGLVGWLRRRRTL
ncbi:MAG: hypothetical protein ACYST5_17995 [Planctomycetota bacterium]